MANEGTLTRAVAQGAGPYMQNVQNYGRPPIGARGETAYWEYFDTFAPGNTTLIDYTFRRQLFNSAVGGGYARNLNLQTGLPSMRVFENTHIWARLDMVTASTTGAPVNGEFWTTLLYAVLNSTKLTVTVDQKEYLSSPVVHFTNVIQPEIFDFVVGGFTGGLSAQTASPIFSTSANTNAWAKLPLMCPITWGQLGQVNITVEGNAVAWWTDVFGAAPTTNVEPWITGFSTIWRFYFGGYLTRNVK